jgi:hypothetical protein
MNDLGSKTSSLYRTFPKSGIKDDGKFQASFHVPLASQMGTEPRLECAKARKRAPRDLCAPGRKQNPATAGLFEADDGARTRDPQLGKLMLYQLSYVRARSG